MSRQWKPGDVAMVTIKRRTEAADAVEYLAFYCGHFGWYGVTEGEGCGGLTSNEAEFEIDRRPLVVIDPEDREQVQRLADAFCTARWSHIGTQDECDPLTRSSMTEALREFANPIPPPCGASLTLGKEGALYRCSEGAGHEGPHLDGGCSWTAARASREGVTS